MRGWGQVLFCPCIAAVAGCTQHSLLLPPAAVVTCCYKFLLLSPAAVVQALVAQLQARPDQSLLETLKDILQYATPAWLDMFSQLGGLSLLVAAAEQHTAACRTQQQQQQQQDGSTGSGGGGGGGSSANLAAVAAMGRGVDRPAAADALAAAMECFAAVMGRSGGDRLLLGREPR